MLMDEKVDDTRASEKLSAESSSLREKGSEESKERRGGLKRHVSPDVPAVARQRIGDLGGEDSVSQRKKTRTDSAAISHPSDPDEEKECTGKNSHFLSYFLDRLPLVPSLTFISYHIEFVD